MTGFMLALTALFQLLKQRKEPKERTGFLLTNNSTN